MRRIIMMAVTLLAALGMQAQDDLVAPPTMPETPITNEDVSATYIKPLIGATFSRPRYDSPSRLSGKWGLTLGGEMIRRVNKYAGFSLGAIYSQQGYKVEGSSGGKMNINYLNFPLLLNVYLADEICLKGGVQLGVLLSAEASAKADNPLGSYVDIDMSDVHNSTDWSLPVAVCITTEIGLDFEFRYNYGISALEKDRITLQGQTYNNDDPGYNNVFSLTIGYRFKL